jgi:hypothetical protein
MAEEKKEHREVRRIVIEPSENGGHTVSHEYKPKMSRDRGAHSGMSMGYEEPERHVFGAGEGHEMLAHVANKLNVKELNEEERDDKDNDDGVGEED